MAPPWYQPLPPTLQGLSPEVATRVFNTPEVSFGDVLKEQDAERQRSAALIAQKLNNQIVQEALVRKQREEADRLAQESALKQQFSGIDPNNFDPTQGLKIAQGIMLQQGKLDPALEASRASRAFSVSANDRPISAELAQELQLPLDSTMGDARLAIAIRNSGIQRDKVEGVDRRFDRSYDYKADLRKESQGELLPEGFEAVGPGPTTKAAESFRKVYGANLKLGSILDDLETSINATGENQLTGADYVMQRQLVNELANTLKRPEFNNLGAALGPAEWQLLTNDLPRLMSTPGKSIFSILIERGLDRSAFDSINMLRRRMERNIATEGIASNIRPRSTKSQYSLGVGEETSVAQSQPSTAFQDSGSQYTPEQEAYIKKKEDELVEKYRAGGR
jgi:hypothetical protein